MKKETVLNEDPIILRALIDQAGKTSRCEDLQKLITHLESYNEGKYFVQKVTIIREDGLSLAFNFSSSPLIKMIKKAVTRKKQ